MNRTHRRPRNPIQRRRRQRRKNKPQRTPLPKNLPNIPPEPNMIIINRNLPGPLIGKILELIELEFDSCLVCKDKVYVPAQEPGHCNCKGSRQHHNESQPRRIIEPDIRIHTPHPGRHETKRRRQDRTRNPQPEKKQYKIPMVIIPHTRIDPRTMMVHPQHTHITNMTMMRPRRLRRPTLITIFRPALPMDRLLLLQGLDVVDRIDPFFRGTPRRRLDAHQVVEEDVRDEEEAQCCKKEPRE